MSDGKQNTTHESAVGWMILGGVMLALCWLIWYFFEFQIKDAVRWFRISEIKLVALFVDDDYTVMIDGDPVYLKDSIRDISNIPAGRLDGHVMGMITRLALEPMKLIFLIGMGLMGLWSLMFGPGTQFRRKLDLGGIINAQAHNFKTIAPFIKFNPSTLPPRPPGSPVPADLPLFAEALGPEEWLAYNQVAIPDGKLDEKSAYVAFARQLGQRWQGAKRLVPYKQVLLAAFCLKAARKRGDSDDMLGRLAMCWSHDKGLQLGKDRKLLSEARAVLRDRNLAGSTLAKCNQHAFEGTAMLRALQTAREEGGVLAPAQFVWLRGHDRLLWYPLNNLGRQAYHMEALGAMAHFKAEKLTRRPIPRPKLDNAIQSIAEYVASARIRPIPQLDYGKSKKRGIKKPRTASRRAK